MAARRTILYLAVFPFSFFFTRVYTESLFLLVSVMAVAGAYRVGRTAATGRDGMPPFGHNAAVATTDDNIPGEQHHGT